MSWIDDLIKELPAASRYRLELNQMQQENARLKIDNARLQTELDARRSQPDLTDRLDPEIEKLLLFILREEYATVAAIGNALSLTKRAAAMYIEELMKSDLIESSYAGGENAEYYLKPKAKRYLHTAGLI